MAFFSDAEMSAFRAEQEASFDKTCTVRTFTADVVDAEGGTTAGTTTETDYPCRVGNPTAQERLIASRLGAELDNVITLAYDVSVDRTGQIDVDGVTYDIVNTNASQSYQTALRCSVKRLS